MLVVKVATTPFGVMRPIVLEPVVNQRFPSGPAVISYGALISPTGKSDTTPAGVRRPIEPAPLNHRLPPGPAAIPPAPMILGPVKVDTTPAGVMRPIELHPRLVNQRFPSGP